MTSIGTASWYPLEGGDGSKEEIRRETYSKLRTSSSGTDGSWWDDSVKSAEEENKLFEPGDHIIRWSHMAYMYPIQIHGIVLETREDGSVTIVDFGLTKASENSNEKCNDENVMQREESRSRRLNVITLTSPKDIRKWRKVNYGGNLFGVGGNNPFEKWKSWFPLVPSNKKAARVHESNLKFPVAVESEGDEKFLELVSCIEKCEDEGRLPALKHGCESDSLVYDERRDEGVKEPYKVKTLLELYAELKGNESKCVQLPSRSAVASTTQSPLHTTRGTEHKELFPVHIQEQTPDFLQILQQEDEVPSHSSSEEPQADLLDSQTSTTTVPLPPRLSASNSSQYLPAAHHSPAPSSSSCPNKLPKSDPTKLVLARVRFLLQQETQSKSVLPPYHVFYSNSECIAVWCKTGKWTTLQTAVFLHSTAVGNAKQTFLAIGGVAALNPMLIPAIAPLGIAYIGAPWFYLSKCKEKWDQATMTLTDQFWAQAEPEVFVEVIQQWSGLKLS